MKKNVINLLRQFLFVLQSVLFLFWFQTNDLSAQNYGMRDDGGVNLPTVTYWYTGSTVDSTVQGAGFDGASFGVVSAFIFKGTAIKTWKASGGDVTGAQFNFKVWASGDAEPANYTVRAVDWSSDDGGGNQTWAGFGDQIDVASGLDAGTYNVKILFSISGTGTPGITEDGPYTATFEIPSVSSAAEILSFTVTEQVVATQINSSEGTIEIGMLDGADVTALIPAIQISDGATIDPMSGEVQNFSSDVTYTVTAEDNTTNKLWTISVAYYTPNYGIRDDNAANLPTLSFIHTGITENVTQYGSEFDGSSFGEVSAFSFAGAAIKIWKTGSGDVYSAHFNYKVWGNGDSEPSEYTTHNVSWTANDSTGYQTWAGFGSPIDITTSLDAGLYNIKVLFSISGNGVPGIVEDGPYVAIFEIPGISTAAEILSFEFSEQVEQAIINSMDSTVDITVNPDADITNLIPIITISDGATIDPLSGMAQNFSDPFAYTVTAEDESTTKEWTVTVTVAEPNYGLRDDDGVNLPDLTYWYTGQSDDITAQGIDFEGQNTGAIDAYFLKGATIKTWKANGGDITGAQLNYKVWSVDSLEPTAYSLRNVNWTSDDGDGNQTWSDFGDVIDITSGLDAGDYNLKVLFSISGTGMAGLTEDGPYSQAFTLEASNNVAQIDNQYVSCGVNDAQQTFGASMFDGLDLGEVTPTTGLHLYGGGIQTFKSGDYNFIGAKLYYRVYEIDNSASSFEFIDLPFAEELPTPGEEVWETLIQDIDLSTGLANGDYYFEVYFEAKYTTSEGGDTITIVKDNAGTNYQALFNFNDGTGLEVIGNSDLRVYPNPVQQLLNVRWQLEDGYTELSVYSSEGKLIIEKSTYMKDCSELNVSDWPKGLYFLNLTGNKKVVSKRFIVE